jgi:hypothetical protein
MTIAEQVNGRIRGEHAMNTKSIAATLAVIFGSMTIAFAAEPPSAAPTGPSKEMREKMAAFHEQLAACLRSDKPIAECHKEAMKHHEEMMGKECCPMMDKDGGMKQKQSGKTDDPK